MKNDTSNIIDLDSLFDTKNKQETIVNTTQPIQVDWDEILTEWSYRCPKGYPTVVDGVFTEHEEVKILNEILEERFGKNLPLPEARVKRKIVSISQPNVGNDIALKEGLVCLMYDAISDSRFEKLITETQQANIKTGEPVAAQVTDVIFKKLKSTFSTNGKRYGATSTAPGEDEGASMPKNLPEYVKWAYDTNKPDAIATVNNALSAAKAIVANVGRGTIIRDNDFEAIRSTAVKLAADIGIPQLKPDNWCPGDVYVLMAGADVEGAKKATKLTLLNKFFDKKKKIVACSLKEETAQAGKATEFIKNVFAKGEFVAPISQKQKFGTSDNKKTTTLLSNIKRYQQYREGFGRRKQSFVDAVLDVDPKTGKTKVHTSINSILRSVGYSNEQINEFKAAIKFNAKMSSEEFYKANEKAFSIMDGAISNAQDTVKGSKSKIEAQFVKSRNEFVDNIQKYGVKVDGVDSKAVLKGIYQEVKKKDPLEVVSKKTATYELATLIMSKWANRRGQTSDAYAKIANVKNPFAALTAFAIASAGISPSFWKMIGKDQDTIGEAHWFDNKTDVVIKTSKTSNITLVDSYDAAGFNLEYTTLLGSDQYDTRLVFRFADTAIRIEVQRLVALDH